MLEQSRRRQQSRRRRQYRDDTWEFFDVARGVFERPAGALELRAPHRAGQAAVLLPDGRVLFAGGFDDRTSEIFDGTAFRPGAPLQADRIALGAVWLPSLDALVLTGTAAAPELLPAPSK